MFQFLSWTWLPSRWLCRHYHYMYFYHTVNWKRCEDNFHLVLLVPALYTAQEIRRPRNHAYCRLEGARHIRKHCRDFQPNYVERFLSTYRLFLQYFVIIGSKISNYYSHTRIRSKLLWMFFFMQSWHSKFQVFKCYILIYMKFYVFMYLHLHFHLFSFSLSVVIFYPFPYIATFIRGMVTTLLLLKCIQKCTCLCLYTMYIQFEISHCYILWKFEILAF